MESIVNDKIVTHMEQNNLFLRKQHGFVPLPNCMSNLDKWTEMLERDIKLIIYTDFANGVIGNKLIWVRTFLSEMIQLHNFIPGSLDTSE